MVTFTESALPSHCCSVPDKKLDVENASAGLVAVVLDRRCTLTVAASLLTSGVVTLRSPMGQMDGIRERERHLAIDAGARVPTRALAPRVDAHGQRVRLAELDVRRCVDAERHVAVVPLAGQLAVT